MNNTSSFTPPRKTCPASIHPGLDISPLNRLEDDFTIAVIVINTFVAITSTCSNSLVVWTFYRTSSLRTPSNLLILGLAMSDLVIGVFAQPNYCLSKYFELIQDIPRFCLTRDIKNTTMATFGNISLLFITAIITDRFLAMELHLRYQEFVTTKRYVVVMALIWFYSFLLGGLISLYAGLQGIAIAFMTLYTIIILMNIFFLIKISKVVRKHSRQIQAQQLSAQEAMNIPKYKKSVYTIYYVIGGFIFCFSPTFTALLVWMVFKKPTRIVRGVFAFSEVCMMFNGVINPMIYCWRVEGIRESAVHLLRRIFRRCGRQQGRTEAKPGR